MRTDLQGRAYIATDPQAPLATLTGLAIPEHDTIELGYTGDDVTSITYKLGGATVATLTLTYTDGKLTKVVKA